MSSPPLRSRIDRDHAQVVRDLVKSVGIATSVRMSPNKREVWIGRQTVPMDWKDANRLLDAIERHRSLHLIDLHLLRQMNDRGMLDQFSVHVKGRD